MVKAEITVLENRIEDLIDMGGYRPLRFKEFAYVFDMHTKSEKSILSQALNMMISEGKLVYSSGRYHLPDENIHVCTYQASSDRFGFAVPDDGSEDIFIRRENSMNAFTGDTVRVRVTAEGDGRRRREGKVEEITEKVKREVVGDFARRGKRAFVSCPGKVFASDIIITPKNMNRARTGDKVRVAVTGFGPEGKARGRVVEVIGKSGELSTELSVLESEYGLVKGFSDNVLETAEKTCYDSPEPFKTARKDLTGLVAFTIDGKDARDMDDAVSVRRDGDDYILGVHIADVSNYVPEGTDVDREAFHRGTSTYFPEYVIPMLPEKLSNDLCSLGPHEKKKTLSVIMRIDERGRILEYEFMKAEIISRARLNYDDVNALFEGNEVSEEYQALRDSLFTMRDLYVILKSKRRAAGMIDFETEESKVYVKDGTITISETERGEAEELIEHFMLSANECAARFVSSLEIDSVYRVHEKPDPDNMSEFERLSARLGHRLSAKKSVHATQLQKYLESIRDTDGEEVLRMKLLRCMNKARYSTENLGHFALSMDYYTHFTSPIRRYPDLIVHRIISAILSGDMDYLEREAVHEKLEKKAKALSSLERRSQEAERESFRLYACELMASRIDERMPAVITGFSNRGIFVRVEGGIEGLCPFPFMSDYYEVDPDGFSAVGEVMKDVYTLLDPVEVQVWDVSKSRREIDFLLLE